LTYYNASRVVAHHGFRSILAAKGAVGFAFYVIMDEVEVFNISDYFLDLLNKSVSEKYKFDRIDIYNPSNTVGVTIFKK